MKKGRKSKPGELYRHDLVTAMQLSDSAYLKEDSYIEISDEWRPEWNNPVQVPLQDGQMKEPKFYELHNLIKNHNIFENLVNIKKSREGKETKLIQKLPIYQTMNYDLDYLDYVWLEKLRATKLDISELTDDVFEYCIDILEQQNYTHTLNEIGKLGREHDDSTFCEVCLSPEVEEGNDIIFCDVCDIAVHQTCYGVKEIPTSSWLCAPCSLQNINPICVLCQQMKGPMKFVRNSKEWVHVICAWWISEVSIEDPTNVEDIDISNIPQSRYALTCNVCSLPGPCIQCSTRSCRQSYHVTCGLRAGQYFHSECNDQFIRHFSYCVKHSRGIVGTSLHPFVASANYNRLIASTNKLISPKKKQMIKTTSMKTLLKPGIYMPNNDILNHCLSAKDRLIEDLRKFCPILKQKTMECLFNYWMNKKIYMNGIPMIDTTQINRQHQFQKLLDDEKKLKILRINLEKFRTLCYLTIRREKFKEEITRVQEEIDLRTVDKDHQTRSNLPRSVS